MQIPPDRPFVILQLTDTHFGFGCLSHEADTRAEKAVETLIDRTRPDLIVHTGDMIFPFLPRSGTRDNGKEIERFLLFMDSFKIPYIMTLGNHDSEVGSRLARKELAARLSEGKYALFLPGRPEIYGQGNFCLHLLRSQSRTETLVMLDSNMYGGGLFFDGFEGIHPDQTAWATSILKTWDPADALAFFHIPLPEYKEAFRRMRLGDKTVQYCFGSVQEKEEYFGIPKKNTGFFEAAKRDGYISAMFCGHDHLNNISMIYQGIQLTYGMSIDYLSYPGISKRYTQRGATKIELAPDGSKKITPVPYGPVVSTRVRGLSK